MSAPEVSQEAVAAWFDATYRDKGLGYLRPRRAYPIFVQLLGLQPEQRHLDVACGPGLVMSAARARGLSTSGVDLSENAIAIARQPPPDLDARVGNAEELPYEDATFDGVTCIGSLERFLDRERALREMIRVAKPSARFCFLVRNASTLIWRVWRQALGRREVAGHQDAQTLDAWHALFGRCGLRVARVLPDQWPRQRWRQLLPGQRPQPGRSERVSAGWMPLRWCNELIFLLEREDV